ncbi:uncharacterized protein LOC123698360 isoform X2 [Colias croceus]|uniref:uncharacterized protein LOC123698360 isoform X2 n=1 Tax=Colias crocea TaxID=72248 RepID=UPI001E281600|nr:uncharacterized protein LOC123698360 isoform X2 [Colias croceus]
MYEKVFVFGTKIFQERKRDAISSLPLELSSKIFFDAALRIASRVCKIWERIIMSNRNLRRRLNHFELATKFGSERRAKFYKRNRKMLKKMQNFLPVNKCSGYSRLRFNKQFSISERDAGWYWLHICDVTNEK